MLFIEFFSWWYTRGYARLATTLQSSLRAIWYIFSIPILLKTLFAPWKRIQTEAGKGLQNIFRAMLDNIVSRAVGFTIRLFTIIAALICIIVMIVVGMIMLIVWPFLPFSIPVLIIMGLI